MIPQKVTWKESNARARAVKEKLIQPKYLKIFQSELSDVSILFVCCSCNVPCVGDVCVPAGRHTQTEPRSSHQHQHRTPPPSHPTGHQHHICRGAPLTTLLISYRYKLRILDNPILPTATSRLKEEGPKARNQVHLTEEFPEILIFQISSEIVLK